MVAAETRGSTAARPAACTLPRIGVNDPADEQRLQADHAARLQESANFQLGGLERLTGVTTRGIRCRKAEAWRVNEWYMDDGDIVCHPILVLLFLLDLDVANARVGAERNPLKTEVIYNVNDLDAAPPERRIGDGRNMAKTSAVTDGSNTSELLLDLSNSSRTSSWARLTLSERCTNASSCVRTCRRSSLPPKESGSQLYQTHPAGSRPRNPGGTKCCSGLPRDRAAVSRTALSEPHRGQHDGSDPQCRPVRNWGQKSASGVQTDDQLVKELCARFRNNNELDARLSWLKERSHFTISPKKPNGRLGKRVGMSGTG